MRNTKIKRILLIGATWLGIASILSGTFLLGSTTTHAATAKPYQISNSALKNAHPHFTTLTPKRKVSGVQALAGTTCLPGLDSISNFCGTYTVPGFGQNGASNSTWQYNMVGKAPWTKGAGTTTFNAPIIPVAVQLLNPDGSVAYTYDPMQYVKPVLKSPVFSTTNYSSSSSPTQFTDALQRAEFFNQAKPNWHTMLAPVVKPEETMKIPYGSYFYALNPDGTCCQFVLVDLNEFSNLFIPPFPGPPDNSTILGAAENSGTITTHDISTFLFLNTFLYLNGDPNYCCILGFHGPDVEPGAPSNGNRIRGYPINFSSWVSPGLISSGAQDVTVLSHEMSETFNDPFVQSFNNLDLTPWWLSEGLGELCQDNLEVGDVIEVLPNSTYPIKMAGMIYHPQNEAMLQWFESNHTSNAIDGAYSYPNESLLTDSNISQNFGCSPPIV